MASVLLAPADYRRFEQYWQARTEELGRADGLAADSLSMKTLVIPIRQEDADATLSICLEQWGRTLPRRR